MVDLDIESEEGAQAKVDAHEELDNPHAGSASMADLDDVGGEPVGLDSAEFDAFLQDQESANEMVSAPVTMGAVVASLPAMDAVAASETAIDAVSMSQTARDAIGTDGVGYDAIATVPMAIGKYAAGLAGLDATNYADIDAVATDETAMDAVAASETAMDAVAASETAMDAVTASETAMDAVAASETAMDAVVASPLPITAFLASQYVMDVVYSSEENTNRLLSRATTFTPTEDDWTEASNGWDGPDGEIEVRYGSNLSDSEGWGADGGFDDTPSEAESVIGFSPQGSEQGRRTLGFDVDLTEVDELKFMYMHQNGFDARPQEIIMDAGALGVDATVVFNNEDDQDWTDASVDLSSSSGEVTFEFGFGDDLSHDDADRWCGFTAFEFN